MVFLYAKYSYLSVKAAYILVDLLNVFTNIIIVFGLSSLLVHGQVTIIFVVSVCLFVCAKFFSAVFDPISIKLGHMLYVCVRPVRAPGP